jgi:hypothetical protein
VVLEKAEFGRGRVYHPILYEWGGGRSAFGGRRAAYGGGGLMVSPLPSCGGFGVGEMEGMGGDMVNVRYWNNRGGWNASRHRSRATAAFN